MSYLTKTEGKTKMVKIRNATYGKRLVTKPTQTNIEFFGHVLRMPEDNTARIRAF